MKPETTKLPVLLLAHNRPALTVQVLEAIRVYAPEKLYFSVDGPNPDRPDDEHLCEEVRRLVEQVDWDCEVHQNYSPRNLGCRRAVAGGISWFFRNEPEGIVLEDDCVPNESFFFFLEQIIHKYREDKRVWGATGANTYHLDIPKGRSYDFIPYALIWGWATWADRWQMYDEHLETWSISRNRAEDFRFRSWRERVAYAPHLSRIKRTGLPDTWDYQWGWTVLRNQGLWVLPAPNMVRNIGLGKDSTHTDWDGPATNSQLQSLESIHHPSTVLVNNDLAESSLDILAPRTIPQHLLGRARGFMRNVYRAIYRL